MTKKMIEITEKDKKKMIEEYNHLVLKSYFQPYDIPMTSGWFLFAFSFCLFCSCACAAEGDMFSAITSAFMSGMNLVVYLVELEE